jgi:hypothetical protein
VAQGAKKGRETMAVSFKGAHFPQDIIYLNNIIEQDTAA